MENTKQQVAKIREQYVEKQDTLFMSLKKLDAKVKLPSTITAYVIGILGALVMGIGMCLAMHVMGNSMIAGVIIGLVGIAMVSVNYPIYNAILKSSKKKHASEIIALSDELLNNAE